MKTICKYCFNIFIIVQINVSQAYSQTNLTGWQLGFNFGGAVYQGDLSPSIFGSYKSIGPIFDINVSRYILPGIKLRSSLTIGQLSSDEGKYSMPLYRRQRNLSFTTSFTEISETVHYNFLEDKFSLTHPLFSPYVFAGVGVSFLNVNRNAANVNKAFLLIETESAFGLAQDLKTNPPKTILVLPVGFGVAYAISPMVSLNAEVNYNFTRTDYLDGYSKVVQTKKNDGYYFVAIGVLYNFNKKGKLDCPDMNF